MSIEGSEPIKSWIKKKKIVIITTKINKNKKEEIYFKINQKYSSIFVYFNRYVYIEDKFRLEDCHVH